ncbi:hypothetical protein AWB82_06204 [Caballeronia glebae]|uniref:Right handed beta helix domain-containing protein n=1 Tax=Caballeronia glebae TaxID=1777143 RepID=A0A158D2N4_9BURK|nr:hypothetical protein [Caballeronia glebae]SAK88848.1 hypothetical protein AWB82_06204 [Caballeronia glebae]
MAASKNGISASGLTPHTPRLANSYSVTLANNQCNYNADEGIQYGLQCGIAIVGNIAIGNGDLGIEGDTSFATTKTAESMGFEIPSQTVLTGNYIDGRKADGTLGLGGIGFSGGNEGVCIISNNIVRCVSGKMGIAISQNAGGYVLIEGNLLDQCNPGANQHQIQARAQYVKLAGNVVVRPGADYPHSFAFLYGTIQTAIIDGNYAEAMHSTSISVAPSAASLSLLRVAHNTFMGSSAGAIAFAPDRACAVQTVDVSSNLLLNVNASGASDKRAITIRPSSSDLTVTVAKLSIRDNTVTYAGTTLYPVGMSNMQASAVATAEIVRNDFGAPTMPYGNRSIDSNDVVAPSQLFESSNNLPGQRATRGTAPPTDGSWAIGDAVTNSNPASASSPVVGWVCTAAGTPGTWKSYGALS